MHVVLQDARPVRCLIAGLHNLLHLLVQLIHAFRDAACFSAQILNLGHQLGDLLSRCRILHQVRCHAGRRAVTDCRRFFHVHVVLFGSAACLQLSADEVNDRVQGVNLRHAVDVRQGLVVLPEFVPLFRQPAVAFRFDHQAAAVDRPADLLHAAVLGLQLVSQAFADVQRHAPQALQVLAPDPADLVHQVSCQRFGICLDVLPAGQLQGHGREPVFDLRLVHRAVVLLPEHGCLLSQARLAHKALHGLDCLRLFQVLQFLRPPGDLLLCGLHFVQHGFHGVPYLLAGPALYKVLQHHVVPVHHAGIAFAAGDLLHFFFQLRHPFLLFLQFILQVFKFRPLFSGQALLALQLPDLRLVVDLPLQAQADADPLILVGLHQYALILCLHRAGCQVRHPYACVQSFLRPGIPHVPFADVEPLAQRNKASAVLFAFMGDYNVFQAPDSRRSY